jgi:hypothetical protein
MDTMAGLPFVAKIDGSDGVYMPFNCFGVTYTQGIVYYLRVMTPRQQKFFYWLIQAWLYLTRKIA